MTARELYWILKLDDFHIYFCCWALFGFMFQAFATVVAWAHFGEVKRRPGRQFVRIWLLWFYLNTMASFISMAIPTTTEMATMTVLPLLTSAVHEPGRMDAMPPEMVKLANEWIEALSYIGPRSYPPWDKRHRIGMKEMPDEHPDTGEGHLGW